MAEDIQYVYEDGVRVPVIRQRQGIEVLIHNESLVKGSGLEYHADPNMGGFSVVINNPQDFITLLKQVPVNEDGWATLKACSLTSQLIAIQ